MLLYLATIQIILTMTNISTTLIENLTKNYIFYIPSSIYSMVESSELKGIIPKDEYDKIVYLEDKSNMRTTNLDQMILIDLMRKKDFLKQNLITLLDVKTSLSSAAFDEILKGYQNHLKWHLHVSSWMQKHLKSSFPKIKDVLINAFKFQTDNFSTHSIEIERHFKLNQEDINLNNIDVINNLKVNFDDTEKKKIFHINPNFNSKSAISKASKKDKIIITDEEIDNFLLETIFNVEL